MRAIFTQRHDKDSSDKQFRMQTPVGLMTALKHFFPFLFGL
jgi:hypothetical protein